jgi:organic hydroperoxide reductase OsmC/OhrA
MSEHRSLIRWQRGNAPFTYETYDRTHRWRFAGGAELEASSAPEYRGRAELPNPEEALVVALSSCHMLTFLAIASRKRLVVDAYEDDAVGFLAKNEAGKLAMTRVVLRPRVAFAGAPPPAEQVAELHERAHRECFIANSVVTQVEVEARESA